jgi:hypothetical protein
VGLGACEEFVESNDGVIVGCRISKVEDECWMSGEVFLDDCEISRGFAGTEVDESLLEIVLGGGGTNGGDECPGRSQRGEDQHGADERLPEKAWNHERRFSCFAPMSRR